MVSPPRPAATMHPRLFLFLAPFGGGACGKLGGTGWQYAGSSDKSKPDICCSAQIAASL